MVEPTGEIENDPDLTDKKFPVIQHNPTVLYIHLELLEKLRFGKDAPEQVIAMKDALLKLKEQGINSLNEE